MKIKEILRSQNPPLRPFTIKENNRLFFSSLYFPSNKVFVHDNMKNRHVEMIKLLIRDSI